MAVTTRIADSIQKAILGKRHQIENTLIVLLSGGHLLIEDIPGVGKTMLARALGASIDCSVKRIQFTPDLLPSDITGVSVFNPQTRVFEFKPGGIFANIVLADEINRASPKTQSALLEAMGDRQVSADGNTYALDAPFMVVATQNPIEMEGTFPLPEAQRDRFTARISMGYPDRDAELAMFDSHGATSALEKITPVTTGATVNSLVTVVESVHISDGVKGYILDVVRAIRDSKDLRLGPSPRAALQLLRTSRARAAMHGRNYVTPDDVQALVIPVLAHRVLRTTAAQLAAKDVAEIVREAAAQVAIPKNR